MSLDDITKMYAHPGIIQQRTLERLSSKMLGDAPIVEPNSTAVSIMEGFSTEMAGFGQASIAALSPLYAHRAQTAEDLYKHMSDFDYLGLFSEPAPVFMNLMFQRDALIESAIPVNDQYSKVIIPKDSEFLIAGYKFGIFYPIEIRINRVTGTIIVQHDAATVNPLSVLTQVTLEHRIQRISGLDLISIKIPLHQFTRETYVERVVANSSLSKSYPYTDKFYAARVWTKIDGVRTELKQTLSDDIYDLDHATAQVKVDADRGQVRITIPQVYINNGQVYTDVEVAVYTTKGELDIDISNVSPESISAKFTLPGDPEIDKYVEPITRPSILGFTPISTRIVGGSNGLTFDEHKHRVKHNAFRGDTLIGPMELESYFKDIGFKVHRHRDGLTNRIYKANRGITDGSSNILPAASLSADLYIDQMQALDPGSRLSPDFPLNPYMSVKAQDGTGVYIIKPTQVFKYSLSGNTAIPLTVDEMRALDELTPAELVAELNNTTYLYSPYYYRIDTSDRFPLMEIYDFSLPEVNRIEFLRENPDIVTQLSVYNATVETVHNFGFIVELTVTKTSDLADVNPLTDIGIVLSHNGNNGNFTYQSAVYDRTVGDHWIFKLGMTTDFEITGEHEIDILSMIDLVGNTGHRVPMDSDYNLTFYVKTDALPAGTVSSSTSIGGPINALVPDFTPTTEQSIELKLGRRVEELFNNVDVRYTDKPFITYTETKFAKYDTDQFERDSNGNFVTTLNGDGDPVLNKIHDAGGIIYNQTSTTITDVNKLNYIDSVIIGGPNNGLLLTVANIEAHLNTVLTLNVPTAVQRAGQYILDAYGHPQPLLDINDEEVKRTTYFQTEMLFVDYKLTRAYGVEYDEYRKGIAQSINSYFTAISSARPKLLEETKLFFEPLRSIGYSKFRVSDEIIIDADLEMTIGFKLFVEKYVAEDLNLQAVIKESIITIVDKYVSNSRFSLVELGNLITAAMDEYIVSIDIYGINGSQTLQTLMQIDDSVVPHLKQKLFLDDDGSIQIDRGVDITFVAAGLS